MPLKQVTTPKVPLALAVWFLSFITACGGVYEVHELEGMHAVEGELVSPNTTFSRSLSASGTRWASHPIDITAAGTLHASLDWTGSGNFDLYLYDPTGKIIVQARDLTKKPEVLRIELKTPGQYKYGIKCRSGRGTYTLRSSFTATSVEPVATGPRFPGDPGVGKLYLGAATHSNSESTYPPLEALLGAKLGMARLYYLDTINWSHVDAQLNAGRHVNVSFKPGSRSLASIGSGAQDAWIDGIAAAIKARAPKPIFLTFNHEPENDFTTEATAAEYRAAIRRIVLRLRTQGVTNFTYVTTHYMSSWTFVGSGRDWRWWYPDWKGTTAPGTSKDQASIVDFYTGSESVVDVVGYDVYNFWEPGMELAKWRTFESHAEPGLSRLRFLDKPSCIGEWGTMAYQVGGTYDAQRTRDWFTQAYDYMLKNNVVCAQYWDNDFTDTTWNGSLADLDPQNLRYEALGELMARPATVLPTF